MMKSAVLPLILSLALCSQKQSDSSIATLLLVGAAVGLSPQNAGAGQTAASPGAVGGTDIENAGSGESAGTGTAIVAPSTSASEDHTPPRLVRIEWPAFCQTLANGYHRCDSKASGPEFIFDEPIDCNSAPQLSGRTIVNGGTIKVYQQENYAMLFSIIGQLSYNERPLDQSVAVTAKCTANRIRLIPVIDDHDGVSQEGQFVAGAWTAVLVGGIKDLAGNVTPDGDTRFAGPIGDLRDYQELASLFNFSAEDHPPSSYVSAYAVRGNTVGDYLPDFVEVPWIDQRSTSDGRLRIGQASYSINCDNTEEMKRYFTVEIVTFDDYFAGKPFQVFPITKTSCDSSFLYPMVIVDPPIPAGSLVRLRIDGSLKNKQGTMTLGSGKYLELLENIAGVDKPIPRLKYDLVYRWADNLGAAPVCQNLEVDQVVTHFDSLDESAYVQTEACSSSYTSTRFPYTSTPEHYFYQSGQPIKATGVCVQYTGPRYLADYPDGMESVCLKSFPGVPKSLKPPEGGRVYQFGQSCANSFPINTDGKSYVDTGLAGMCIENPGKDNEYVIYYFTYEEKAAGHTACKGIWRESGTNYGHSSAMTGVPGSVKKVTAAICPSTDSNAGGGVTTAPPTGQTCAARTIEIDTTGGRWFNTPDHTIPVPDKPGKVTRVKGIHTYWQDEPLKVRINRNCQAGYYKLTFKGMNVDGPLPDFYKAYALTVSNDGQDVGAMVMSASDSLYNSSSITVYLKEGDNVFDIRWKNDAYKERVYDANFHLGSVSMAYVPDYKPVLKLAKNGRDVCDVDGRFFFSNSKSAWTTSANQQISYCYPSLKSGKYEISITAKNHGSLPQGFAAFNLEIFGDGVDGVASIAADSEKSHTGKVTLDFTEGDKRLDLTWINDVYVSDDIDSAIEIESIKLKRVGDSERSPLASILR